jgi:hypothetical protein
MRFVERRQPPSSARETFMRLNAPEA